MVKVLITVTMALVGLLGSAQVSETRNTKQFTGIEAKNGIEVIFTQSEAPSLKVEAGSDSAMANIITERQGSTLTIFRANTGTQQTEPVKVYVSGRITSFRAETGAVIRATNEILADKVAVALTSGGWFTGSIKCTDKMKLFASTGSGFEGKIVTAAFSGDFRYGSVIRIRGFAKAALINTKSDVVFAADKFIVENASVSAENNSTVALTIVNGIDAGSDESSSITYFGNPVIANIDSNSVAMRKN